MNKELRGLIRSFRAAFAGVFYCIRSERNMRIHLAAVVGVVLLSLFYPFTALHYAVLALLFALVIAAEMINTAVERVVDLASPDYSELAKRAKDAAAGAVLVCAVAAVVIGVLLFRDESGIRNICSFVSAHPISVSVGCAAYLLCASCLIFLPRRNRHQ